MPLHPIDAKPTCDVLAAYTQEQYATALTKPGIEQDNTPTEAVASSTTRFVSRPVTIVTSASVSATSPYLYTIKEAARYS